jgi:hypothetical protein
VTTVRARLKQFDDARPATLAARRAEEAAARATLMPRKAMRSKYHATPTVAEGIRFGSKLEARRFTQLRILQAAGDVLYFIRQPRFDLAPGVQYVADFLVVWRETNAMSTKVSVTVEDTKGVETAMFRMKLKLMAEAYPNVTVRVLTRKDLR